MFFSDEEDGESGSRIRSKSKQKKSKKKHSKEHSRKKSNSKKEHRSSRRESPSSRRKSKKKLDIAVRGVPQFSDIDASDVEYAPPKGTYVKRNLNWKFPQWKFSPRSCTYIVNFSQSIRLDTTVSQFTLVYNSLVHDLAPKLFNSVHNSEYEIQWF